MLTLREERVHPIVMPDKLEATLVVRRYAPVAISSADPVYARVCQCGEVATRSAAGAPLCDACYADFTAWRVAKVKPRVA